MEMSWSVTSSPVSMLNARPSRIRGPVVIPPQGLKKLPDDVLEDVAEQLEALPPRLRVQYYMMLIIMRKRDPVGAQRFVASMRGALGPRPVGDMTPRPSAESILSAQAAKLGTALPGALDTALGQRGALGGAVVMALV